MATTKINLQCDIPVRDIVCAAIRDYAFAAYPEGSSDCAQVARSALLDLAAQIETGIHAGSEAVLISRRPRAMVKAAFTWYYDRLDAEQGGDSTRQRERLQSLLREQPVRRADLDAARAADHAVTWSSPAGPR